jgi:ribosome-binding protein aMBF1 (putative translation factor)
MRRCFYIKKIDKVWRIAVAKKLHCIILDKDIDPSELAIKIGISKQSIYDFMNGRNIPNDNVLKDLFKELEINDIKATVEII